tara:strand:+ start:289 stop:408 length:120 start_codon:yes stop_codon:yes gene_type:complete
MKRPRKTAIDWLIENIIILATWFIFLLVAILMFIQVIQP